MVHVFQAFPFAKSEEAIESIGWWTKVGIPLITQWQTRQDEHTIQAELLSPIVDCHN